MGCVLCFREGRLSPSKLRLVGNGITSFKVGNGTVYVNENDKICDRCRLAYKARESSKQYVRTRELLFVHPIQMHLYSKLAFENE